MSAVRMRDGRRLPWFQVTKAETARLAVVAEPRMLPYLRSLYFALIEIANDHRTDEVAVSRSDLAREAGVSPATVKRLTSALVGAGLVRVDERPGFPSVWTVLGVGSGGPDGSGLVDPRVGSASVGGSGLSDPTLNNGVKKGEPKKKETPTESGKSDLTEVWEHYQQARKTAVPRSNGCKLGEAEKRLIRNALKVRSVEDCRTAIDALFQSDYHRREGYIGIKYALLGGGRSPTPAATIDRWIAKVSNGTLHERDGNGRPIGLLESQVWPDGRTWPELTAGEQYHAKDAAARGLKPWLPPEEHVATMAGASNGNGNGRVYTAQNFADDD